MTGLTETAPAKPNLHLHVTGRRADGHHELDSLVALADAADALTVRHAPAPSPRRWRVSPRRATLR